jgi:uncharacterized protein (DUF4415 family)
MGELSFSWDPKKAQSNKAKHGISFDEAQSVFSDENGLLLDDTEHSERETRFLLNGCEFVHANSSGFTHPAGPGHDSNHQRPGSNAKRETTIWRETGEVMKKEYDFSKAKRNPYAKRLKKQVTIRLDEATVKYFKKLSEETGVPYQTLINLYLRDCAAKERKLKMTWQASA